MTLLYAAMLLCYLIAALSLLTGQGFLCLALVVIAMLLRRVSVLEQQMQYLLHQSEVNAMRRALQGRDMSLKQPEPLRQAKGL